MSTNVAQQVVATDAALAALRNLTATFGPLMLFQSGGCCDGSSPICLAEGELLLGPNDLLLGEVGGVPVLHRRRAVRALEPPTARARRRRGPAEGFSLEGLAGIHFLLAGCPVGPSRSTELG